MGTEGGVGEARTLAEDLSNVGFPCVPHMGSNAGVGYTVWALPPGTSVPGGR